MTFRYAFFFVPILALQLGCPPKATDANTSSTAPDPKMPEITADSGALSAADQATLRKNFKRVHFDFDSSTLTPDARKALSENAEILADHPSVFVEIEGHTDNYGSDEYNLALGDKRAQAVKNYLVDLGVLNRQVRVISYGKEAAIVAEGSKDEQAVNRRAEFKVVAGEEEAGSSESPTLLFTVGSADT